MKSIIAIAVLIATSASAKEEGRYLKVRGKDVFNNHYINQMDDTTDPAQAYDIVLPKGYSLVAADVESGGTTVCSVVNLTHKNNQQRFQIEALVIETDEGGCTVTLSLRGDDQEKKVQYSITQEGT